MNTEQKCIAIGMTAGSLFGGAGYTAGPFVGTLTTTGGLYVGLLVGKLVGVIVGTLEGKDKAIGAAFTPIIENVNATVEEANGVVKNANISVKIFNSIISNLKGSIAVTIGIGSWFFIKMFNPTYHSDCWGQNMLQNCSLAVAFIGFAVIAISSLKSLR